MYIDAQDNYQNFKIKDNRNMLHFCCQYANTRYNCHFFKQASFEGFGDGKNY